MKRFFVSLGVACLLAGTLWAKDDPFCGKWKLNLEKSKFAGEQSKIEDLGGNKYKWTSGDVCPTRLLPTVPISQSTSEEPYRSARTDRTTGKW